jgi:hypothetical protein
MYNKLDNEKLAAMNLVPIALEGNRNGDGVKIIRRVIKKSDRRNQD